MADNNGDVVRVVCNLPVENNRMLQAQASLEGISKQQLIANLIQEYVDSLEIGNGKRNKRSSK